MARKKTHQEVAEAHAKDFLRYMLKTCKVVEVKRNFKTIDEHYFEYKYQ